MNNSPTLMVIDDDPDLLDIYKEILQIEGLVTVSFTSGEEALEYCQNNSNVKIIISDAHMGEMSGMTLLKKLKEHNSKLPTFYLLTGAFNITEEEVKSAGGRGLILKPFDLDVILERIKKDIK